MNRTPAQATRARQADLALPPGQRLVKGFPRFGTHLHRPAPPIPLEPVIEVCGAVATPVTIPLTDLAALPRREMTADFHCVAGWSAADLQWEGVAFADLWRLVIEPSAAPDPSVTHISFGGLDGYRSVVQIGDALADDVLIAAHLHGRPLDTDHGAPVRLVSPGQYGYISTKHLCRIELRTSESTRVHAAHPVSRFALRGPLVKRHPRARVWHEERHPDVSAALLRPLYRLVIQPGILLCARGSRRGRRS